MNPFANIYAQRFGNQMPMQGVPPRSIDPRLGGPTQWGGMPIGTPAQPIEPMPVNPPMQSPIAHPIGAPRMPPVGVPAQPVTDPRLMQPQPQYNAMAQRFMPRMAM